MKLSNWIAIIMTLALLAVGVHDFNCSKPDTSNVIPANALTDLQDSVRMAKADLKKANEMIATLRSTSDSLGRKIKLQAATIAELTVTLPSVSGSGVAASKPSGWKEYKDDFVQALYRVDPDSFKYTLLLRTFDLTITEGLENNWSAYAWDPAVKQAAVIKSLKIQRNENWQPKQPWFKQIRLGAGLGYYKGFHLAGEIGVGRNLFIPKAGVDENFRAVYGGTYIREIGF